MNEKLTRLPPPTFDTVGAKLSDLINYGEINSIRLNVITQRTNRLLGLDAFDGGSINVTMAETAAITQENILKAAKYLSSVLADYRKGPDYLSLKLAYDANNQSALNNLIPKVFPGVHVDYRKPDKFLYHGILIDDPVSPEENLALALKIMSDGFLFPSPHGVHHSMDENIRPVYTVVDPEETHGLLFFTFSPKESGYTVFDPEFQAERLIFSPKMKVPLRLFLKSEAYFSSKLKMPGFSTSDGVEYRNRLEALLVENQVEYQLAEPTGYQRFH